VDVERADDRRVEALEVEDEHAGVQARDRLEHEAAGALDSRVGVDAGRRRDAIARAQLAAVDELEGGDAATAAIERQTDQSYSAQRQLDQLCAHEDVAHETRILERIGDEAGAVVTVSLEDTRGGVLPLLAFERLAAAE